MSQRGFTLFEMVIVLAISSILLAATIPVISTHYAKAQTAKALQDCQVLAKAAQKFYEDNACWPGEQPTGTKLCILYFAGDGAPAIVGGGWTAGGDDLSRYLATNTYAYPTNFDVCWRGPYIQTFSKDPWGSGYVLLRYGFGTSALVYALSPGPNKVIDTVAGATAPQGDDIGVVFN
jgi:prepilin-type N-terminal cleavage/methylation domain-containing protein